MFSGSIVSYNPLQTLCSSICVTLVNPLLCFALLLAMRSSLLMFLAVLYLLQTCPPSGWIFWLGGQSGGERSSSSSFREGELISLEEVSNGGLDDSEIPGGGLRVRSMRSQLQDDSVKALWLAAAFVSLLRLLVLAACGLRCWRRCVGGEYKKG